MKQQAIPNQEEKAKISEIRNLITEGKLSFIVGAGFSKNLSTKFPDWKDLLINLIEELYPFVKHQKGRKHKNSIQRIIAENGYLGLASKYVRHFGYHESIDLYIEKNIPYLKKDNNGCYKVYLQDDPTPIDESPDIRCHQALIALGVPHIFTFNYDNAIDIFAGTDDYKKINENESEAIRRLKLIKKHTTEYKKNQPLQSLRKIQQRNYNGINSQTVRESETQSFINQIDQTIQNINLDMAPLPYALTTFKESKNWDETESGNLKALEESQIYLQTIIQNCRLFNSNSYHLVANDYDISLTENGKNIYKLHGNLRRPPYHDYGFDNDKHRQYIITTEDYETYQKNHEAFVSLMRISLLRDSFCIIGFSGEDPNFNTWINWVKDILDKDQACSQYGKSPKKIYFIHIGKDEIPPAKLQLLKNNYITPVEFRKLYPYLMDYKDQVLQFLTDIRPNSQLCEEYENIIRKLSVLQRPHKTLQLPSQENLANLYDLIPYNRFPQIGNIGTHNRMNILCTPIEQLITNSNSEYVSKLIYIALKGEFIPIHEILPQQQVSACFPTLTGDLQQQYRILEARSQALHGKTIPSVSENDDIFYENLIGQLFTLQFTKVCTLLQNWKPTDKLNRMRKIFIQAVFNDRFKLSPEINRLLLETRAGINDTEYGMALDLLPSLLHFHENTSKEFYERVRQHKQQLLKNHPKLVQWYELKKQLITNIPSAKNHLAYGNAPHSITLNRYDQSYIQALKILQIHLEIGLATELRETMYINPETWDFVAGELFENYPLPILYFTLLYGNSKDIVKRITQYYIYSDSLIHQNSSLLNNLLHALCQEDTPEYIRYAIYISAPLFMRAVAPELWNKNFKCAFKRIYKKFTKWEEKATEVKNFLETGLRLCDDSRFKQKVIKDILSSPTPITDFQNCLLIDAKHHLKKINAANQELLTLFLSKAQTREAGYVLLNFQESITPQSLIQLFISYPRQTLNDPSLLEGCCRLAFTGKSKKFKQILRSIVLNSRLLWNTGISSDLSSVYGNSIHLDIIQIQKHIGFNQEEIHKLYQEMKESIQQVAKAQQKWPHTPICFFNDCTELLCEMHLFMHLNRQKLQDESDYTEIQQLINELLNRKSNSTLSYSLLLQEEHTIEALNLLAVQIDILPFKDLQTSYILIIQKILSKNCQYLNSCFLHFSNILKNHRPAFKNDIFPPLIQSVLDTYQPYFDHLNNQKWDLEYAEKDVVEKCLIKLYNVLHDWKIKLPFWENYQSRYYK